MVNSYVYCLMGPTASGKTDIACELVKRFPMEIISVDSAMIYRGMDIGTAKPSADVLATAPHHLINIRDPNESYSAAEFCDEVNQLCHDIVERGRIPLLVGGTMMYFHALQQGLSELPTSDERVRQEILEQAQAVGWDEMHRRLMQIDPMTAERLHPHDTQRIQRALEVFMQTGKSLTDMTSARKKTGNYHFINMCLLPDDRAWLHVRIAERFKQMLAHSFIEEVQQIVTEWSLTLAYPALRCVGYRQVYAYLLGECSFEQLEEKGIAATRQLAKRQLTWLRHWPDKKVWSCDAPSVLNDVMQWIERVESTR